jgi:hypothetical protein
MTSISALSGIALLGAAAGRGVPAEGRLVESIGRARGDEQGLSVLVAPTCFAVAAGVRCSRFWASLRAVAEP